MNLKNEIPFWMKRVIEVSGLLQANGYDSCIDEVTKTVQLLCQQKNYAIAKLLAHQCRDM